MNRKVLEKGELEITYYPYERGFNIGWNKAIDEAIKTIELRRYQIQNPSYLFDENKLHAHVEALVNIRNEIKKLKGKTKK